MNDEEIIKYLKSNNFSKNLNYLTKKLEKQKNIIYGCGQLFRIINENYNLSKLNIIGIYDKNFQPNEIEKYGYHILKYEDLKKCDNIIIATLNTINIAETLLPLHKNIYPLIKKKFVDMLKEVWNT